MKILVALYEQQKSDWRMTHILASHLGDYAVLYPADLVKEQLYNILLIFLNERKTVVREDTARGVIGFLHCFKGTDHLSELISLMETEFFSSNEHFKRETYAIMMEGVMREDPNV